MIEPIGRIVIDLRVGLAADGGRRVTVRGGRRYEGGEVDDGKKKPADSIPLVIVRPLSRIRSRAPIARHRVVITSYAEDPARAAELDGRVSDQLHERRARLSGGVAIWRSVEDIGGQPGEDPDTHWSSATSFYSVPAATVPVTP
jgi:hypothetical protein